MTGASPSEFSGSGTDSLGTGFVVRRAIRGGFLVTVGRRGRGEVRLQLGQTFHQQGVFALHLRDAMHFQVEAAHPVNGIRLLAAASSRWPSLR